jgi:hypothetical protein
VLITQVDTNPPRWLLAEVLDGKPPGQDFDLYSGRVSPSGSLELGTLDLAAGQHRLRFAVVGKNTASTGFCFGIDAIDILSPP